MSQTLLLQTCQPSTKSYKLDLHNLLYLFGHHLNKPDHSATLKHAPWASYCFCTTGKQEWLEAIEIIFSPPPLTILENSISCNETLTQSHLHQHKKAQGKWRNYPTPF